MLSSPQSLAYLGATIRDEPGLAPPTYSQVPVGAGGRVCMETALPGCTNATVETIPWKP